MQNQKSSKTTQRKELPQHTADYNFTYLDSRNKDLLDELREDIIPRLEKLRDKVLCPAIWLEPRDMYDVFYQETTYKLCVIQDSYGIVGVACLQEQYEAFKDAHGLFVVFTQLDNTKGLLKRVTEEWDRIADTEGFSYVRFNFIRHGWAKLMDKYPGEGYNVVEYVGEKVYGRWRR